LSRGYSGAALRLPPRANNMKIEKIVFLIILRMVISLKKPVEVQEWAPAGQNINK
jgi:hypothetical protein